MNYGGEEEYQIGATKFQPGMGIVTQIFNPYKEIKLLENVSARENLVQVCKQQCQDCAGFKPFNPYTFLRALNSLRFASITVIQEILEVRFSALISQLMGSELVGCSLFFLTLVYCATAVEKWSRESRTVHGLGGELFVEDDSRHGDISCYAYH